MFYKVNSSSFPTLFAMAMDYLPIQSTSVPCERVFSSSAETDTRRRNRINPLLMEALQMLKFYLKKKRLNFTKGWMTSESEMTEDVPDTLGLVADLLQGNFDVNVEKLIEVIGSDGED
jgi:hypothetical protein